MAPPLAPHGSGFIGQHASSRLRFPLRRSRAQTAVGITFPAHYPIRAAPPSAPRLRPMHPTLALSANSAAILNRMRGASPRVQCLTNTVAQQITANVLLAAGARVSMATHPDEVVDMSASADAVLINLGTLDAARVAAIPRLLADQRVLAKPRVLDPVFVEHSPLRRALAVHILAAGPLIVKGNAAELAALALPPHATRIETGAIDRISGTNGRRDVGGGHPWMAQV
jgi:hydroxyethylthiazole kinase